MTLELEYVDPNLFTHVKELTMSNLRNLLGTRHRHHLALEGIEQAPVMGEAAPATEDTTVVMKGPLADVYSDALGKVYDKENPIEQAGDPAAPAEPGAETGVEVDTSNLQPAEGQTQETVEAAIVSEVGNIVLESQAIDAAVASSIASSISDEPPSDNAGYETLYAVDETQVTPETVQDVTEVLAATDKPENVTVLIDNVVPDAMLDPTNPTVSEKTSEMAVALESLVVAMGGKVVHSYGAFVKARAERRTK